MLLLCTPINHSRDIPSAHFKGQASFLLFFLPFALPVSVCLGGVLLKGAGVVAFLPSLHWASPVQAQHTPTSHCQTALRDCKVDLEILTSPLSFKEATWSSLSSQLTREVRRPPMPSDEVDSHICLLTPTPSHHATNTRTWKVKKNPVYLNAHFQAFHKAEKNSLDCLTDSLAKVFLIARRDRRWLSADLCMNLKKKPPLFSQSLVVFMCFSTKTNGFNLSRHLCLQGKDLALRAIQLDCETLGWLFSDPRPKKPQPHFLQIPPAPGTQHCPECLHQPFLAAPALLLLQQNIYRAQNIITLQKRISGRSLGD